jgi:hypothetical protein
VNAFDMIVKCSERQNQVSGGTDSAFSMPPDFCDRCGEPRHFTHSLCITCRVKDQAGLEYIHA